MADVAGAPALRCERCGTEAAADAAYCGECGVQLRPDLGLPGLTIVRTLGRGGAADVYLARQESLDREVAVKVLRADIDDERAWKTFEHEAKTIARLSGHPNVVTVYTAGRSRSGRYYLVTEYLEQGSLEDVVARRGPLPHDEVTRVGVAIVDAMAAAHALGIHHRDVKPANVLVGADGRIKLADFGIARLLAGRSVNTTDVMAFTPEHVAPEVLRSEPDGAWSDVYGLASTLATVLLGQPPFERRKDERVDAYLTRKLTSPPAELPADVPPNLARPITAGLESDPRRRPTVEGFRAMLTSAEPAQRSIRIVAPPAAATSTGRLLDGAALRRPRWRTGAVVIAILALLGGVVAAFAAADDDDGTAADGTASPASSTVPVAVVTAAPVPSATASAGTAATPPSTLTETTAAPTMPATPTPTAAPSTGAPTTPSPPASGETIGAAQAETFIREYFDLVDDREYEVTWTQLAPEFQNGRAVSYEYYVEFWDENDVKVRDVVFVGGDTERAAVRADLRWNDDREWSTNEFTLRRGGDGRLLIAEQTSV